MALTWTAGKFLRIAVITLVVLGFVPLLMVSGSRLAGGSRNGTAQLASFAPLAAGCWVLALVLLVVLRSWWFAGFAGLLVVLHLAWMTPPVLHKLGADPVAGGVPMRVLTINAQFGGASVDDVAQIVRERSIDLIAVQEMTPEFDQRFTSAVRDQLPSHVAAPAPNDPAAGTGIWSRWPLQSQGVLKSTFKMPKVLVTVPGAGPVEVVAVHTLSPLPSRVTGWKDDLEMLADQARADVRIGGGTPVLMLGDFNATRDHAPFRSLISGPLADLEETVTTWPWLNQTWPNDRRFIPPSVRIDHILASKGDFSVTEMRTYTVTGTDHRAVQADLQVRPGTGVASTPAASPSGTPSATSDTTSAATPDATPVATPSAGGGIAGLKGAVPDTTGSAG